MTRLLYQWLLWLHPRAFRQEFAGEMLWIFEEASGAEGVAPLFADGVVSLLRQWLLRSGSWNVGVAVIGAMVEFFAGGGGMLVFGHGRLMANLAAARLQPPPTAAESTAMNTLIHLATWVTTGVLMMVVLLVFWVKRFNARRIHAGVAPRHQTVFRHHRG